jgi:hypothetical protein
VTNEIRMIDDGVNNFHTQMVIKKIIKICGLIIIIGWKSSGPPLGLINAHLIKGSS